MDVKGFSKGAAVGIGLAAIFPPLAPLAVAGLVGGAGITALSTPFRSPNVAPNAFQQQDFRSTQQPQYQRSVLTR